MKPIAAFLVMAATVAIYAGRPKYLATFKLPNACPGITTIGEVQDGSGCYVLLVTFIGKRPSNDSADKACRAYLAKVPDRFHRQDILVTSWFRSRKSGDPYDDDQLHPYPGFRKVNGVQLNHELIYEAKSGKVIVK